MFLIRHVSTDRAISAPIRITERVQHSTGTTKAPDSFRRRYAKNDWKNINIMRDTSGIQYIPGPMLQRRTLSQSPHKSLQDNRQNEMSVQIL
jgi:hypothetical protein